MASKNICRTCGVKIRKNSEGFNIQLCEPCFDIAGLENAHVDGHHKIETVDECPMCVIVPVKIVHAVNSRVRNWKPTRRLAAVG